MKLLDSILYILAAVCFLVAFLGWTRPYGAGEHPRSFNLVALGLLLWVLVPTIHTLT